MATYTARYVRQFSCTGGDCPDTCCSGLTIGLTEDEVVRLQRGPGTAAWRDAVEKEVQPPPPGVPEGTHAVLAHPDGACAFLEADRLCAVHKALGPEGLNSTCRDYPRQSATVGDDVQVWGSLGCPEMARLAFTEDDALELIASDGGPSPRRAHAVDPSRAAVHALLDTHELPLHLRFGGMALALDAASSIEALAAMADACRDDPAAFEETLTEVGADSVLRAVVGRDGVMARRPISRHHRFTALVDDAVFARTPTSDDLHGFFVARSDAARADLEIIEAVAAQSEDLRDDGAYALAAARYASWRWATRPPADIAAARVLWGRILMEIAAAELLMTSGAHSGPVPVVIEAFQVVAREMVNVPDLDVLYDAYVSEQGLDRLRGQIAARPGPGAVAAASVVTTTSEVSAPA